MPLTLQQKGVVAHLGSDELPKSPLVNQNVVGTIVQNSCDGLMLNSGHSGKEDVCQSRWLTLENLSTWY